MCGRYVLKTSSREIARKFRLEMSRQLHEGLTPRYNIAPGAGVLAVWDDRDAGRRKADFFHWGLVPGWAKDVRIGYKMINARSETASEKPAFRDALRYRRCLLPADGFYEWKGRGAEKIPYYFAWGAGELFAMAGLWEHWQSPDGSEIFSCSVLTTPANELMSPIHHRMPLILHPRDYDLWLNPAISDLGRVNGLLASFPSGDIRCHRVSDAVNALRHEGPELVAVAESGKPGDALDFFDQLFPNGG